VKRFKQGFLGVLCALLLIIPRFVEASGFTIYEYGAEEQAEGNAVVAQTLSPSTIFYNPAGLTDLPGVQVKVGTSVLFALGTFDSNTPGAGSVDFSNNRPAFLPYLFSSWKIDKLGLGFGFFSANGDEVNYPVNWEGRFFLTSAKLIQYNFAPTAAYQISEYLSAGVSPVITYSQIQQGNQIGLSPLGFPGEGSLDLSANGVGIGATIGVKAQLGSSSLGAVYKSPTTIRFSGSANFSTPGPLEPLFPNGGFHTLEKFPQMVVLGYGNHAIPNLTLEADLQWTNWSIYKTQTVEFDQKSAAVQNSSLPFDWRDTWTVRVGGHYDINDCLVVRLGYVFDPSAVPDSTVGPLLPEPNKHIASIGLGIRKARWTGNLYYARIFNEPRHVDNSLPEFPSQQGTYTGSVNAGGISLDYKF